MKLRLFDMILKLAVLPVLVILGGCASGQKLITLSPVGPIPSGPGMGNGPGHLIVYNASHEAVNRDGSMAYPYDGYKIYNEHKACIKHVRSRPGSRGEIPALVDLSPGRYTVITQSETQGAVAVPVIIKSSLTTKVDLEQPKRIITPASKTSNEASAYQVGEAQN